MVKPATDEQVAEAKELLTIRSRAPEEYLLPHEENRLSNLIPSLVERIESDKTLIKQLRWGLVAVANYENSYDPAYCALCGQPDDEGDPPHTPTCPVGLALAAYDERKVE